VDLSGGQIYVNTNTSNTQPVASYVDPNTQTQNQYNNSPASIATDTDRLIYNPYKKELNFVDALALRVYCRFAPVFLSDNNKCYVRASGVVVKESEVDLNPINQKLV
jgi:hypothetical protein